MSSDAKLFLDQAFDFQLGQLPTESRHPRTTHLSELAQTDVASAIQLLQSIELESLQCLSNREPQIAQLASDIQATLRDGGRIFFCGCGATGRLSLSLETLWREQCSLLNLAAQKDKVISFMAGGDYALIRSIEKFEDHFDYGARQLRDSGFDTKDLLIASTEGGETPFVIGAVEEALRISSKQPYFNYCNPTEQLANTVERSQRVLTNKSIRNISFETGPMALSGSTRLQASTVLMLAGGAALFSALDHVDPIMRVRSFIQLLSQTNISLLAPLVEKESDIYRAGEYCIHESSEYAMTVVTDTTERTPTFSLVPFETCKQNPGELSWTYLYIPGTSSSEEAWNKLLGRQPRALNWQGFTQSYGFESMLQFDFSMQTKERRLRQTAGRLHSYQIKTEKQSSGETCIRFSLGSKQAVFTCENLIGSGLLERNLLVKCALNFSSTLVMGRLGRFSGNLMLYVRATNNKLVDRAIRYVKALLEDEGFKDVSYEVICEALFEVMPRIRQDEPIVKVTCDLLRQRLEPDSDSIL